MTKEEQLVVWLDANPGKTERDWLIEERCSTSQQRSDLRKLLELCDYIGVKYLYKKIDFIEEVNEFCNANQDDPAIQEFKENYIRYIEDECPVREYDLYFPSKHWVINIGEEIKDVNNQMQKKILDLPVEKKNMLGMLFVDLSGKFENYLNEKYHYPCSDKESDADKTYLPWGKDSEISKPHNLKTGAVSSFYAELFKEDIEKARKKSIEDFLVNNPEIGKQRTDMLHDYCKALMNGKKLELCDTEIRKLLKQTDKELAAIYPAFKEAALM